MRVAVFAPIAAFVLVFALHLLWALTIGYYSFPLPVIRLYTQPELSMLPEDWSADVGARLLFGITAITFIITMIATYITCLAILTHSPHRRRTWLLLSHLIAVGVMVIFLINETSFRNPTQSMQAQLLSQVPPRFATHPNQFDLAMVPSIIAAIGLAVTGMVAATCSRCLGLIQKAWSDSDVASAVHHIDTLIRVAVVGMLAGVGVSYGIYNWPASITAHDANVHVQWSTITSALRQYYPAHVGLLYSLILASLYASSRITAKRLALQSGLAFPVSPVPWLESALATLPALLGLLAPSLGSMFDAVMQ